MWGWVFLGAAALIWFIWWSRRPHHHRSGGMSSRDGYIYNRIPRDLTAEDKRPNHPMPGDYDGD